MTRPVCSSCGRVREIIHGIPSVCRNYYCLAPHVDFMREHPDREPLQVSEKREADRG